MKVIQHEIERNLISEENRMKMQEVAAQILRSVERNVCHFRYALPNGWRCIVKIVDNTPDMEDNPTNVELLHLDVQSNRGGGSWAEAKIQTMETISTYQNASRPIEIGPLYDLASRHASWANLKDSLRLEFANASNVEALSADTLRWLVSVDEGPGLAPGYGGITVPYDCQVSVITGGGCCGHGSHGAIRYKIKQRTGLIRIAFSGASQEQDLFFATSILRTLVERADKNFPSAQAWFNLRAFEDIPAIKMWLDLLGVREA